MPRILPRKRRRKWLPLARWFIRQREEALAATRKGRTYAPPRAPKPPQP